MGSSVAVNGYGGTDANSDGDTPFAIDKDKDCVVRHHPPSTANQASWMVVNMVGFWSFE